MKLILHVGWSKTGTSAIQHVLHQEREQLLRNGVLYPLSIQKPEKWGDHSHHEFALASRATGGLAADFTFEQAADVLIDEIKAAGPHTVIISSELSPFYFGFPEFNKFVERTFSTVFVVLTVRRQSELLLSFYNQVIKDYNTGFVGSIFELFVKHIAWMNYFENTNKWAKAVGQSKIIVVPYTANIVGTFMQAIGLGEEMYTKREMIKVGRVNQSIPNGLVGILRLIKMRCPDIKSYEACIDDLAVTMPRLDGLPLEVLLSAPEQQAIDQYFDQGNREMARRYLGQEHLFDQKDYADVMTVAAHNGDKILQELRIFANR